ncbi:MAG: hypothetical protein IJJ40_02345 [Clostridia bacterium]|nr:hypothetical protein [Clostridia bacterium]
MIFTVKLADVNIKITSIYDEVFTLCKDYLSVENADFCVTVSESDITFEREKAKKEAAYEGIPYTDYTDSYLETLAVYRKIAVGLLDYDTFLMHGAVVGLDGKAYLFTAPSGVGKTTHTKLWLETFPGAFIINGDKPLISMRNGKFYACGSPWAGKEGQNRNTSLPLCAVCVLARGKENEIIPLDFDKVFPFIISQTYRPVKKESIEKTMKYINELGKTVKFYYLRCNMDSSAAKTAFRGMNEQ